MRLKNIGKSIRPALLLGLTVICLYLPVQAANGYPGFNLAAGYASGPGSDQGDNFDPDRMTNLQFVAMGTTHIEGMHLGFRYERQNIKYSTSTAKQSAIGGTVGFGNRGAYILAHWFWNVSRETENGTLSGTGTGYDFGYQSPFFYKNFLTMGAQYSLRYTTYKDDNHRATTQQFPMFVIGGNF